MRCGPDCRVEKAWLVSTRHGTSRWIGFGAVRHVALVRVVRYRIGLSRRVGGVGHGLSHWCGWARRVAVLARHGLSHWIGVVRIGMSQRAGWNTDRLVALEWLGRQGQTWLVALEWEGAAQHVA